MNKKRKSMITIVICFLFILSNISISKIKVNAATDVTPPAVSNLAAGKLFTTQAFTNLPLMTDGNKNTNSYADDYPNYSDPQFVQADLGTYYDLSGIKLWHYFGDGRKYHDVIVQVSNDPTFSTDVTTVYNNDTDNTAGQGIGKDSEYLETSSGLNIDFNAVNARYVRLYSNGSNMNRNNHYVEVEVYGSKGAVVHPSSISLNKTTDTIAVGATDTLTAKVLPLNTTDKGVTWSSSAPGVATVSSSGLVTGTAAGTAAITATTADGDMKASCDVTVTGAPNNLTAGKQFTSSVFTGLSRVTDGSKSAGSFSEDYPAGGGLQYIQLDLGAHYDISNIKLWHYYGDGRKYHDVAVLTSNDPTFTADVTTVYNNDTDNSAKLGTGTNSEYTETSAGLNVQFDTVNARYVRLYSNGSNMNSSNHYVEVEVYGSTGAVVHPSSVSLNKTKDTIAVGATDTLTAKFMPLNTTDKGVTWSSSNANVATVSSSGVVAGVAVGTAVITATTTDGDLKASCDVTVASAPSNLSAGKLFASSVFKDISLITDGNKSAGSFAEDYPSGGGLQYMQLDMGAYYDISNIKLWHYYGDGRKYHDVIVCVSNDPTFANDVTTVYNNDNDNSAKLGIGTNIEYTETSAGLNVQFDTVNARYVRLYSNGSNMNSSNHYVEVEAYGFKGAVVHPSSVSLNKTTDTIAVGATDTLTAKFMPMNTTDKGVIWSSSAPGVATVSSSGVVEGVAAGTAVITATTADGSLQATCDVTVTLALSNLSAGKLFASSVFKGISLVTDGSKSAGSFAEDYPAGGGLQYIQLDLGAYYDISNIKLWHYYGDGRKYHDVIIRVSNDPTFAADVTTVYNNDTDNSVKLGTGTNIEYAETSDGLNVQFDTVNARYVRLYSNGSSMNSSNHYVEVQVYGLKGSVVHPSYNLANSASSKLSSSGSFKNLDSINDRGITTSYFAYSGIKGLEWVQVDMGASYRVNSAKLWHYFGDSRKYHDVIVQFSNDPDFNTGVVTVFNNDTDNSAGFGAGKDSEYPETGSGKAISFNAVNARYARFYSNGNTVNGYNHYIEVELYDGVTQASDLNVKSYGAKGDGIADDTAAIQKAIDTIYANGGGNVNIPDGTYLVNPDVMLRLKDNITLNLSSNAVLQAKASSKEMYGVVYIANVTNAGVTGGKIIGERLNHIGTTGEWGHGIWIVGGNNIHVSDVSVSNCWGDGIYIGIGSVQKYSGDVLIERVNLDNNRRQGISVISAKNLTIKDSVISNTNGTPPGCGIDFEPNNADEYMQNVVVENLTTMNNQSYGIDFYLKVLENSTDPVSITILNHKDTGSLDAIADLSIFEQSCVVIK